jgi:hypothetical protein
VVTEPNPETRIIQHFTDYVRYASGGGIRTLCGIELPPYVNGPAEPCPGCLERLTNGEGWRKPDA